MTNRIILRNILGFLAGAAVFIAAQYLLSFLMGLLLRVPFIVSILSWPSTPALYASTIINAGSVGAAFFLCYTVCLANQYGRKFGLIILSGILSLLAVFSATRMLIVNGFSDPFIGLLFAAILSIGLFISSVRAEDI